MIGIEDAVFIGKGIVLTLELTVSGLAIGALLGAFLAIARYKGCLSFIIERFISIVRGTPIMVQLSFFYFAVPGLFSIPLDAFVAGMLTLGLNSSAYIAEILRAGIESLPKGQFEAAKALRIPPVLMWRDIIIPQVLRNIFPALINEAITLLKETALISVLGELDIMRRAQSVAAEKFSYFGPICMAGFYYYVLVLIIEYVGQRIERRWAHARNH